MKKLFERIVNLFKRKRIEPVAVRSSQQIANDKHRDKYRLEFIDNVYFIQYYFNGEWWYLRRLDDDYIFEEKRGKAIRIITPPYLEDVITKHQEWLSGGRFFLPFK